MGKKNIALPSIRISHDVMKQVTDSDAERNIYVHSNPLARDIFWQRLDRLYAYLVRYLEPDRRIADVGGGSGAFIKGLAHHFDRVEVLDRDPDDAIRLRDHFKLDNCTVLNVDLATYQAETPYDALVFADVLEHFADLSLPIDWIHRHLDRGGLLFVSLPTENWIYELGRRVVNKQKPADHYHTSRQVIDRLTRSGFAMVSRSFAPTYLLSIPLFEIAVLKKTGMLGKRPLYTGSSASPFKGV